MDSGDFRARSVRLAGRLGYPLPTDLPLLESNLRIREVEAVIDRTLARYAAVAVSFGFDPDAAAKWLEREGLPSALAPSEQVAIAGRSNASSGVESLWALCWALGIVDELDFGRRCDDDFIAKLPNLKTGEQAAGFRGRARLREVDEIGAELDLAYCLHWAVREAALASKATPGMVPSYVVVERRRALEWLAGEDDWDATSLDT